MFALCVLCVADTENQPHEEHNTVIDPGQRDNAPCDDDTDDPFLDWLTDLADTLGVRRSDLEAAVREADSRYGDAPVHGGRSAQLHYLTTCWGESAVTTELHLIAEDKTAALRPPTRRPFRTLCHQN